MPRDPAHSDFDGKGADFASERSEDLHRDSLQIAGSEVFISVDVETAGPDPQRYALLSIGACLVLRPESAFYVELQPTHPNADEQALSISGLSMVKLAATGVLPAEAMTRFADWIRSVSAPGRRPIFVAFNAPFDWMFVHIYFHRYLGHNPFGHSALDLKALYMGLTGAPWSQTSMSYVAGRFGEGRQLTHHALADARDQASLLRGMLREARNQGWPWLEQADAT